MCRLLGEFGLEPDMVMGHSLGEYGALVAAGVLHLRRGPGGGRRARPRDEQGQLRRQRGDGGGDGPGRLRRRGAEGDRRLRRAREPQRARPGRDRGRDGGGGAGRGRLQQEGLPGPAPPGEPRVPHEDRRAGGGAAAQGPRPASTCGRPGCRSSATSPRTSTPRSPRPSRTCSAGRSRPPCAGWRASSGSTPRARGPSSRSAPSGPSRASWTTCSPTSTDVMSLFTNRPRPKEVASFNQALAGLYAAGYGAREEAVASVSTVPVVRRESAPAAPAPAARPPAPSGTLDELRALLQQTLESLPAATAARRKGRTTATTSRRARSSSAAPASACPGADKPVMDPKNAARILAGEQFIGPVPQRHREGMARRRITQLVKTADGSGHFQTIDDPKDVIKLAGRAGLVRPQPPSTASPTSSSRRSTRRPSSRWPRGSTRCARRASRSSRPGRRPPPASTCPSGGCCRRRCATRRASSSRAPSPATTASPTRRTATTRSRAGGRRSGSSRSCSRRRGSRAPARRSRGGSPRSTRSSRRSPTRSTGASCSASSPWATASSPSTSAPAGRTPTSTPPAPRRRPASPSPRTGSASGRCRRVVVVAADNVTSDALIEWIGAGFIASGAGATDERVEDAALPFDRRRHGTLIGMGACALVVESQDAVEERGMRGIVELLSAETRNSAFHATRLDVEHVASVVESLVASAERRFGVDRDGDGPEDGVRLARDLHAGPRRQRRRRDHGAARRCSGPPPNRDHRREHQGLHRPPDGRRDRGRDRRQDPRAPGSCRRCPTSRSPTPTSGNLTLSKGGRYDVEYAIHLAAGFGSQIALTLTRRIPGPLDRVDDRARHERWLADVSGHDRPRPRS